MKREFPSIWKEHTVNMTNALLVRSRPPYMGIVLSQSVCALIGVSFTFVSANDQSPRDMVVFDAENANSHWQ